MRARDKVTGKSLSGASLSVCNDDLQHGARCLVSDSIKGLDHILRFALVFVSYAHLCQLSKSFSQRLRHRRRQMYAECQYVCKSAWGEHLVAVSPSGCWEPLINELSQARGFGRVRGRTSACHWGLTVSPPARLPASHQGMFQMF